MSASLDPIVVRKLTQFARRRRQLLVARGLSAGLVTFLLGLAIVGFADWYWLLSDQTRWLLSTAVYLSVFGMMWRVSLRHLLQPESQGELASRVEELKPELREHLLSAVELATDDVASIHDSPGFRQLLQGQVAQQMIPLRIRRLLPLKLVAKWLAAALLITVLAVVLLSSSDTRFRQLATRALLPGANIARISRIQVEILEPTPHSLILAEDETVAIVVRTSGGHVETATLETSTPSLGNVRQSMQSKSDGEFVTNIHVADESVEYRIFAGDAVTQRYRIESRPRPHVLMFNKLLHYPEYAGLPDEAVHETNGDLLALTGTLAELVIEVDQEVSQAELRIDPLDSDELRVLPLELMADKSDSMRRWSAQIPVVESAVYKVHLVSKETGFENTFSPKYEIRPQPDLIPRTGFVDQTVTTLLLPPNELLGLKAMAEDDLPLAGLEQHISVNGRDWEAFPLEFEPTDFGVGRQVASAWQWDLVPLGLKTGDQILTKLVALDRKGNIGESVPLRIVVAAVDFDPHRHEVMQQKVQLYDTLADYARQLEQQRESALEVIQRLEVTETSQELSAADRLALLDIAAKQQEQAEQVLDQLKQVEREMPPGADAHDLDLAGRVVARLQREHATTPKFLLQAMQQNETDEQRKAALDALRNSYNRTADDAKYLAEHYQTLMSHNFLRALAIDLDALLQQQSLIVASSTQTWTRLLRQETVVLQQLEALENLVYAHRDRLPQSISNSMNELVKWSDAQRLRLQDAMESEDKLGQLQAISKGLLQELQARQRIDVVDGGLPGRINEARKDFERRAGSLYEVVDQVGRAAEQENRWIDEATNSTDSVEGKQALLTARRFEAEIDLKQRQNLQRLTDQRDLTQNRRDADSQYAADAALTHRAASFLLNQFRQETPRNPIVPANLLTIAPAYRTLEAGHQLSIAYGAAQRLLEMERWEQESLDGHLNSPRQWDLVQQTLETASARLREAGVPNEIVGRLDQIRWSQSTRDANRKITERRWNRELMVGAAQELLEIREALNVIVQDVEPVMVQARETIAQFAPTIPELAQQAAEQLRELEEATAEAADQIEESQTPEATEKLAELQQQQEQVDAQLENLYDALVDDANAQDLLDEPQRERARDADASIALIEPPAAEMNRAMQAAQEEQPAPQQVQQLAQAAEGQERTAQALDLVAEHFERLDEGADVAQSREQLRPTPAPDSRAQQMEAEFAQAQQLAEMLDRDATDLMTELEAELQQNPAMQQALSEIAKNTLEDARDALELAAKDDENIQRGNERADEVFQQRKRELAEDVRDLGAQANQLANALVARAQQSSAIGKTEDAARTFQEAQQQLQAIAAKANTAREDQLLSQLGALAQEAKESLREATEKLREAKDQTQRGQAEAIHAEEPARQSAQQKAEQRDKEFAEQQKKAAENNAKRADDLKNRADQQTQQAEQRVQQAEQQVAQAKANLDKQPQDAGRKQALVQQTANLRVQQGKLQASQQQQQRAAERAEQAKANVEEAGRRPQPQLDKPNPDTQLADRYGEDALKVAEAINRQADQLVDASDFDQDLAPPRNQLASALEQQQDIGQDVQQVAEDVARAARHERRLNRPAAAEAIRQSSEQIQQVADQEVAQAESSLGEAVSQADQSDQGQPQEGQAARSQQALANSQQALSQQADALAAATQPLLAQGDSAADANGSEPGGENSRGQTNAPNSTEPAGASGQPMPSSGTGEGSAENTAQSSPGGAEAGSTPAAAATPQELARAQQLARALDELDRLQATTPAQAQGAPAPTTPSRLGLDSLTQAAGQQRQALAASRAAMAQQAVASLQSSSSESTGIPPSTGPQGEFELGSVNRLEEGDWGRLRRKSAEDVTRGRGEGVSEEYRKSVEAYFRVLSERASQGQRP